MKLVKFNRSMAPFSAGETRAVPDDEAARLIAEGAAEHVPSVYDKQPAAARPRVFPNLRTRSKQ